jgi:hypothetical protein
MTCVFLALQAAERECELLRGSNDAHKVTIKTLEVGGKISCDVLRGPIQDSVNHKRVEPHPGCANAVSQAELVQLRSGARVGGGGGASAATGSTEEALREEVAKVRQQGITYIYFLSYKSLRTLVSCQEDLAYTAAVRRAFYHLSV